MTFSPHILPAGAQPFSASSPLHAPSRAQGGAGSVPQGSFGHAAGGHTKNVHEAVAGVSLKPQHYQEILSTDDAVPGVDFFEVHAENYFGAGGAPHRYLSAIADRMPLSIHGIGLSLGGASPLNQHHLENLRALVERYQPMLVSEHLAWCENGGAYFNDLLPVALTHEALAIAIDHVHQTQDVLGRQILVENPSSYLAFADSEIGEPEFLSVLAQRTGCGLLLDVNNVAVSAHNLGTDPYAYLDAFDVALVGEIHIAGHSVDVRGTTPLRIDDHGSPPTDEVWALYAHVIERAGACPTLLEWDTDVPPLSELASEARRARDTMHAVVADAVEERV